MASVPAVDLQPCPTCGGEMQWKNNRSSGSRFMGCVKWPACTGTRDEHGVSSVISAQRQNRMWAMLKAAILAADDECLTFSEEQLTNAGQFELHLDEITEEKSYILTVRRKL